MIYPLFLNLSLFLWRFDQTNLPMRRAKTRSSLRSINLLFADDAGTLHCFYQNALICLFKQREYHLVSLLWHRRFSFFFLNLFFLFGIFVKVPFPLCPAEWVFFFFKGFSIIYLKSSDMRRLIQVRII